MLNRLLQPGHGHRVPDKRGLALNLSFVLHELSDGIVVRNAVSACQSHARALPGFGPALAIPLTSSDVEPTGVTLWLTATIGLPFLLAEALATSPERVIAIDEHAQMLQTAQFFRGPAQLALPDSKEQRIGVAALILRPDRRSSHLAVTGVHEWPADRVAALRSLERLIQAHAGQWMPARALWDAPAETRLAAEVY